MIDFDGSGITNLMKKEPLHPALVDYVQKNTFMGELVHSPLVIMMLSMGREYCSIINAMYLQKLHQCEDALQEADFHRFVMLHERPYRYDAIAVALEKGLEGGSPQYWKIVGQVWMDSENIHENLRQWKILWGESDKDRYHVMSTEDRERFSQLPKQVRIYRGVAWRLDDTEMGMSWTTDRKKAIWFAHRFDQHSNGVIWTGVVDREDIYAFFGGRDEHEVVIDPVHIKKLERYDL